MNFIALSFFTFTLAFVLLAVLFARRSARHGAAMATLARVLDGEGRIVLGTFADHDGREILLFAEGYAPNRVAGCRFPGGSEEQELACYRWLCEEGWTEQFEVNLSRVWRQPEESDDLPVCIH